jgi:hypothetical protein
MPDLDQTPDQQADALAGAGARALAKRNLPRGASQPEALEPLAKVTDDASYEAIKPGKQFLDPEGNTRTKAFLVTDEASYDVVPEGAQYIDPDGNTRTKPNFENVDFTAHTLYNMAVNDRERRKALERSYPGKVKQDSTGEFYVEEDDGTRRKPRKAADPKAGLLQTGALIASGAAPTLLAGAGEVAGGLAGSAAAPGPGTFGGAVAGGGVGGAAGQGFNDLVLQLAGVYDRSAGEEAGELALAGGFGAAGSAVGRGIAGASPAIRGYAKTGLPGAVAGFLGADPEGTTLARGLAEKGVLPPPSGSFKEAPHVQNIVEVFDPAFHTQKPLLQSATAHYEKTGKEILGELGVKDVKSLAEPTEAVPTQKAGEVLKVHRYRALAESKAADDKMREALNARRTELQSGVPVAVARREELSRAAEQSRQAAQRLIDQGYEDIRQVADAAARVSGAGGNGGELWEMMGARLTAIRRGIQERANVMYQQGDELALESGRLPNTEGLPEIAEQFANQLPEEFQRNQPSLVRQIRQMAGERNPETGEVIREPTRPTWGQLRNLRSQIRQNTDFYRLNSDIKNGTYKFFAVAVDRALRDGESVPELRPAIEQLNRADRFYRENMPVFEANQIKAVMRGLESGEPADPKKLFDVVVKEGHTDLTNRIREMVGPNLWAGVQAADLNEMFQASRGLVPGEIDGRAFARQVLDRHRSGILESVHTRDVSQRLLRQAQAIEEMAGRQPITVRPGDTLSEVISRAKVAADAAKEAAKQDPLKALKTEMQRIEREHAQQAAKFKAERKNDPLGFLYDPTTGATEAVNRILGNEDLILAAAARFGEDKPEFQMLRQVHAQRILQGVLTPSARLAKISPEVQVVMFPGTTLDQLQLLAKEMDFLMSGKGADAGAGLSMSATAKVEHPWASILGRGGALSQILTAPTKVVPGADAAGRYLLGSYYGLVRKLTTSPAFLRWVEKGLKGDEAAREVVRAQVQRAMQRGGAAGAGGAEATFQASEPANARQLEEVQ